MIHSSWVLSSDCMRSPSRLSTNQFMSRRFVSAAIHSRAWLTAE